MDLLPNRDGRASAPRDAHAREQEPALRTGEATEDMMLAGLMQSTSCGGAGAVRNYYPLLGSTTDSSRRASSGANTKTRGFYPLVFLFGNQGVF